MNSTPEMEGLRLIEVVNGEVMWVHPDLLEDEQWTKVKVKKKHKVEKAHSIETTQMLQRMGQEITRLKKKISPKRKSKVMKTKGVDELLQEKRVSVTLKKFIPPQYIKKIEVGEEARMALDPSLYEILEMNSEEAKYACKMISAYQKELEEYSPDEASSYRKEGTKYIHLCGGKVKREGSKETSKGKEPMK